MESDIQMLEAVSFAPQQMVRIVPHRRHAQDSHAGANVFVFAPYACVETSLASGGLVLVPLHRGLREGLNRSVRTILAFREEHRGIGPRVKHEGVLQARGKEDGVQIDFHRPVIVLVAPILEYFAPRLLEEAHIEKRPPCIAPGNGGISLKSLDIGDAMLFASLVAQEEGVIARTH